MNVYDVAVAAPDIVARCLKLAETNRQLVAALEAIIKEAPHAGKDERPTGTIDTMVWIARAALALAKGEA